MWQQYGRWISAIVLHGDLGNSLWQGTSVAAMLLARLPVTFELGADRAGHWPGDRVADRRLFGDAAGHARRLHGALVFDPAAGGAQFLARHHGDGVPVDLVGLVATRSKYSRFADDPLHQPEADAVARRRARRSAVGDHDAADAHDDARGAAPGLHPHRLGQGLERAAGDRAPRAAQRDDPGGHADRAAGAAADRRRGDHRADLRHSGHGPAAARCRAASATIPSSPASS